MDTRLALVPISKELFETMFREPQPGRWHRIEGLPADAEFVRLDYDPIRALYWIAFSHPSFPETPENEVLPPVFIRVHEMITNEAGADNGNPTEACGSEQADPSPSGEGVGGGGSDSPVYIQGPHR